MWKTKYIILLSVAIILAMAVAIYFLRHKIKKGFLYLFNGALTMENKAVIDNLNPAAQPRFIELVQKIENMSWSVLLTSGFRDYQSGLALYKQMGNAAPLINYHLFGLAVDLNVIKGTTRLRKSTPKQTWLDTGIPQMAKEMGFRWGGDFKGNYDPIHFDLGGKYPIKEVVAKWEKTGKDPDKVNKLNL